MKVSVEHHRFNGPYLVVDASVPTTDDFLYEDRPSSLLWGTQKGPWRNFFAYAEPGSGYGGARFVLAMTDGSTRELIGPWSSREGLFNQMHTFDEHVVRVRGNNHCSGHMLVREVRPLLEGTGYKLVPDTEWLKGELYYKVVAA